MNQYHSFYVNWFHVFMFHALVCQVWNLSLTTIEFSSQNPINSLPNLLSKSPLKNPQMHPLFAPKQPSNVPTKPFPQRPLHAPTFSPKNSSQICPPNHSFRDPQMHPLLALTQSSNTPLKAPKSALIQPLKEASKCILFFATRKTQKLEPQWQPPRP
jgi:hypothetical protein